MEATVKHKNNIFYIKNPTRRNMSLTCRCRENNVKYDLISASAQYFSAELSSRCKTHGVRIRK